MPSTRLSPHFAGWHDRTTEEINTNNNDRGQVVLREALLERMRLLLPAAARVAATDEPAYKQAEPWLLLHSACFVSCPLALVRLAWKQEPHALGIQDLRARRLPLHYAAARSGYVGTVPVGVSREVRMMEPSPAMELASRFALATRIVDAQYQLPLHIAIDTAKRVNDTNEVVMELLSLSMFFGATRWQDQVVPISPSCRRTRCLGQLDFFFAPQTSHSGGECYSGGNNSLSIILVSSIFGLVCK